MTDRSNTHGSTRRDFLKTAAIASSAFAVSGISLAAKPQAKPNIILCMTDDQGWGDTGYNGPRVWSADSGVFLVLIQRSSILALVLLLVVGMSACSQRLEQPDDNSNDGGSECGAGKTMEFPSP